MLDEIYEEAHVIVIASSREGFPMVIMEAMIKGVVPISTNVGGISEHIENYKNGILIDSVTSEDIINEIASAVEYFASNKNKLIEMSRNASEYAVTHFNKKVFIESYKKILATE